MINRASTVTSYYIYGGTLPIEPSPPVSVTVINPIPSTLFTTASSICAHSKSSFWLP